MSFHRQDSESPKSNRVGFAGALVLSGRNCACIAIAGEVMLQPALAACTVDSFSLHARREEQRMHSELAGALLLRVLQSVQAARLLVSLWPAPCDAVLLLHSLLRAHCSD